MAYVNNSPDKGVWQDKRSGKWRARICKTYHKVLLGTFATKEEALAAYKVAEAEYKAQKEAAAAAREAQLASVTVYRAPEAGVAK